MQKVSRRQQFMLTLPGLLLLAAFLLSGGTEALTGGGPSAAAAETDQQAGPAVVHNPGGCVGEQRKPSFGSAMVVTSGEIICSNLTSFGGSVVIHGEVDGDVVAFGGNVFIDGTVNGNVALYGGDLDLQNGTHVNGDIHICGGRWTEGTASRLHGNAFSCTKSAGALLSSDFGASFHFWFTLAWVILGMLLTTLLPEHVMLVRTTVRIKMRRSLVLGLLSILLAPAILAVLIALIISIPLAILVAVGLIAAWALGTVAIGGLIGDSIIRAIAPQQNTRLSQVVVGLLVLALVGLLPYIGWLISIGAGLLGLGAVFLSRFGTRLYSQPKHPLPL